MRIKYRGWSPDLKRWIYGAYINHCNHAVCFAEDDKPEYHESKIVFEEMGDWSFPYRTMIADVVAESVGAGIAIDGKEFFEGDIVLYDKKSFGIIQFDEHFRSIGFYIKWLGKSCFMEKELGFWVKDIEVIGNIFENKDFLEGIENGKTEN